MWHNLNLFIIRVENDDSIKTKRIDSLTGSYIRCVLYAYHTVVYCSRAVLDYW